MLDTAIGDDEIENRDAVITTLGHVIDSVILGWLARGHDTKWVRRELDAAAAEARTLGLRPASEADASVHLLAPYDPGVFHGILEKGGLKLAGLPQLYVDLLHYERRGRELAEHLRREAMGY